MDTAGRIMGEEGQQDERVVQICGRVRTICIIKTRNKKMALEIAGRLHAGLSPLCTSTEQGPSRGTED